MTRSRIVPLAFVALAIGLLPARLPAQAAESLADELFETVEVEVVNLDVLALDREGRPLVGLSRDDFELAVDGQPTPIGYFAAPAASSTAEAAPPEGGPLLVLLVDLENLRPGPRNDVLRQIRPLVVARLAAGERVLVAAFQGSLRLFGEATGDRAKVDAALAEIERTSPQALGDRIQARNLQREIELVSFDDPNAAEEAARLRDDLQQLAVSESNRYLRAFGAMADLLGTLAAFDGAKTVLWIGESIPERPVAALAERWERRLSSLVAVGSQTVDIDSEVVRLDRARLAVARAAQASRSTFFVLDSIGGASRGVSAEIEMLSGTDDGGATRSLADLAEGSGGKSLPVSPALGATLERVGNELAMRYSLGFTPVGPADDRWHRIALRCRRSGVELRHRAGFLRRSGADRLSETALAAASLGTPAQDPLGLSLETKEPPPAASGRRGATPVARVTLVVRIPIGRLTLVPEGAQHVGRLSLQFATRDRTGRLTRYDPRELPLTVPNAKLAAALRQSLAYEIELQLAPGAHRAAVAVLDRVGNVRGAATLDLQVPEAP